MRAILRELGNRLDATSHACYDPQLTRKKILVVLGACTGRSLVIDLGVNLCIRLLVDLDAVSEPAPSARGRANGREARSDAEDVFGEYDEAERRGIEAVQPAEARMGF